MPFIPDTPVSGTRTPGMLLPTRAPPPRDPDAWVLGAAFRLHNPYVSLYNHMAERTGFTPEPDHNPLDMIEGTRYEAEHLMRFVASRSRAETASIMSRIDREESDRRLLDAAGWGGTLAHIAAGATDPTVFIPMGTIYRTGRLGYDVGRTVLSVGAASGAVATGQELILYGTQETRTIGESTMNVATAAILGGILGGANGYITRA